jgi:hypothetical protein
MFEYGGGIGRILEDVGLLVIVEDLVGRVASPIERDGKHGVSSWTY